MQRWIPPTFARDIPPIIASTPYKRKGIPPTIAREKYGQWIMSMKQKNSIYKLKHRQVCYVHKARTWDNRGLKKLYKGK